MLKIVEVSPVNEMGAARRLRSLIRSAWPDIESSTEDSVVIIVGVEMFRELDLIVVIRLKEPRPIPSMLRRDGSRSSPDYVQAAVLAIEVKQLEPVRFTKLATEIFADYRNGAVQPRSVNAQAKDAAHGLKDWWSRYGLEQPFMFGLSWLTEVDEAQLQGVSPWIVGNEVHWLTFLDAAAQQNTSLYTRRGPEFMTSLDTMVKILTTKRKVSPRDRARAHALSTDVLTESVVDELADHVGTKLVRLAGHGGSGKTTTLVLLAKRLAVVGGERVLILTFHKTLRSDIAHVVATTIDLPGIAGEKIVVETALAFFAAALSALGAGLPLLENGTIDFARFDGVLEETRSQLIGDAESGDALRLRESDPRRFAYDYVFVDESQDWSDAERDFVCAIYGSKRLVVADGLDQLIRRSSPCDWFKAIPKAERLTKSLGRSLRMTRHIATFANEAARASGLNDWRIVPFEGLPGGRIVIAIGDAVDVAALHRSLRVMATAGFASPVDTLVCVPPRDREYVAGLEAAGECVWDGTQIGVRDTVPSGIDCWRAVRYDSCRGLEGWITVAHGLDVLIDSKFRYPIDAGMPGADSWQTTAQKWLMIAITRAVNTLVITIRDPQSPLVAILETASGAMPTGVVQWTTGDELAGVLAI